MHAVEQFTQNVITIFRANEKEGIALTVELQRLLLPYYKAKIKAYQESKQ